MNEESSLPGRRGKQGLSFCTDAARSATPGSYDWPLARSEPQSEVQGFLCSRPALTGFATKQTLFYELEDSSERGEVKAKVR